MNCLLFARPCQRGECLPLVPRRFACGERHHLADAKCCELLQDYAAGALLADASGRSRFVLAGFCWLSDGETGLRAPLLECCQSLGQPAELELSVQKNGYSVAVITLSDKGAQGLRRDTAGPLALEMARSALNPVHARTFLLPDDSVRLRALLTYLALDAGFDLIITTGGTGLSPRDVTPQATARVLDLTLPGMSQAMVEASMRKTPYGCLSRGLAGVMGKSLVINLPGSEKAVRENLEAILPALEHALKKIHGDLADCGG